MGRITGINTKQKQEVFSKLVEHHISIVRQIYNRKGQWNAYLYFDVFAGPGYTIDKNYDGPGSPIIFNRLMSLQDDIEYKMVVTESDMISQSSLKDLLECENAPFELKTDARDCCPKILHEWYFGMAYIDLPMTIASFNMLEGIIKDFTAYCPQVDIVIYISANYVKRFYNNSHVKFSKRLSDFMTCVDKDWIIREPMTGEQYTFLIGTKIDKGLTWAIWKSEEFYEVNSYDGQRILHRLNYTEPKKILDTYGMKQQEMF